MKKKSILLLSIPMILTSLPSCGHLSNMKLTFGTYLLSEDESVNDTIEIDYSGLVKKMDKTSRYSNENFILVIAPTNGCTCWMKFQKVIKKFIANTHYVIYSMKITEFNDKEEDYGFVREQGSVSLAIVKSGSIIKQYLSSPVFDSEESLQSEINKFVKAPDLYYYDKDEILEIIKYQETTLVQYVRNGCGDCNYVNPEVVWPFVNTHNLTTPMYIVDIQDIWETRNDSTDYQEYKDIHWLSKHHNEDYGYNDGYVPTFQYFERGHLMSASVYFNDTIEKMEDGSFKVVDSYYTEARYSKLNYVSKVKTPILRGLTIPAEDVDDYSSFGYGYLWKNEKADVYHRPLLEAFLTRYSK